MLSVSYAFSYRLVNYTKNFFLKYTVYRIFLIYLLESWITGLQDKNYFLNFLKGKSTLQQFYTPNSDVVVLYVHLFIQ